MLSTVPIVAACPKCGGANLVCRYNFFDRGDLQVHSWEHKCGNCGWRQTQAYRSDDPARSAEINPAVCPYCQRANGLV
jgi:hypothetical protein